MFTLSFEDCIEVWQQRTMVFKTKRRLRGAMAAAENAVLASQSPVSQNTLAKTALRDKVSSWFSNPGYHLSWVEVKAGTQSQTEIQEQREDTCVLPVQPPSYSYTV